MKNYFFYTFLVFSLLNGQNAEQIKQRLKDAGINKEQASQMLREQGYSESQIKTEAESRGFDLNKENISNREETGLSIKKDDEPSLKSDIDITDSYIILQGYSKISSELGEIFEKQFLPCNGGSPR